MNYSSSSKQSGFSLMEVLVAIFVALLIGIIAVSLLSARAASVHDNATVQEAETRAEEAISALSAIANELPIGGSFENAGDNEINPLACSAQTCDFVLLSDTLPRSSSAKGVPYSTELPQGTEKMFLRRWRVDEVDADYKLRKISVAIVKDENDEMPVVLEETIIAVDR